MIVITSDKQRHAATLALTRSEQLLLLEWFKELTEIVGVTENG